MSKIKGSDVLDSNGKKIGSVADIPFDEAGKIDAYVVSVDGVSGMEAKDVAIAPSAFQMALGKEAELTNLNSNMDEEQLKHAPTFTMSKP